MSYAIEYFNQGVLDEIESWPIDVLAAYARLAELLMEFGPALVIKKTQTTPQADVKRARRRMREVRSGQD